MPAPTFDFSHLFLLAASILFIYYRLQAAPRPRPPGPRRFPIIESLLSIPKEKSWITYKEWSDQYDSDVISVNALGKELVIINSWKTAQDIFVKQGAKVLDRPGLVMLNDLMGLDWLFPMMRYGPRWRDVRRTFKRGMEHSDKLHPIYSLEGAQQTLVHLHQSPSEFVSHFRHLAGRVVMRTAYGIDVKPHGDPFISHAERVMNAISIAGSSGTYIVEFLPFLKHIPAWFPGAVFKQHAREWERDCSTLPDLPYQVAKKNFVEGSTPECIVSRSLEELQDDPQKEDKELLLKHSLGAMYAAGADSTVSSLLTFALAMITHPEVQRTAHAHLDAMIGRDRLPTYEEIASIPYMHALVREVLRWQPVVPLGMAHSCNEDVFYQDWYFPKGTILLWNAWAMLRDESLYGPDTHLFRPERFLTKDGSALNPDVPQPDAAFGFGRRVCAGRAFATSSLMVFTASILQCFELRKTKDVHGNVQEPNVDYTSGLTSFPTDFTCDFKLRVSREEFLRLVGQNLSAS